MSIFQDKKFKYLWISILILIFVFIYEQFSHGVTSDLMRYSFLFPLIGGFILPYILPISPNNLEITLWYMSLSSLTIGFIVYGVFEIYGSIESLVYIYFYFGTIIGILSAITYLFRYFKKEGTL